jgi:hypothetical protein
MQQIFNLTRTKKKKNWNGYSIPSLALKWMNGDPEAIAKKPQDSELDI